MAEEEKYTGVGQQPPTEELSLQEALRLQAAATAGGKETLGKSADQGRQEFLIAALRMMGVVLALFAVLQGILQSSSYSGSFALLFWGALGGVGMLIFFAVAEILHLLKTIAENTRPHS